MSSTLTPLSTSSAWSCSSHALAEALGEASRSALPAEAAAALSAGSVSVGTDVVQVSRLEGIIERWGEGFLRRAFTELELAYCRAKQWPVVHLAGRLAGKEAVYKALDWQRAGRGSWSRIEVLSGATGKPYVVLPAGTHRGRGYAGSWASEAPALSHVDVSIAHDGDYAVAVAYAVWSEG